MCKHACMYACAMRPARFIDFVVSYPPSPLLPLLRLRNWSSCHEKLFKTNKLDPKAAAADDGTRRSSGSIACGSAVVRIRT